MVAAFKNMLKEKFPELNSEPVLVACSGGLDSVALAHLCQEAGVDFGLAHADFGLRGAESEGDAFFVRELALSMRANVFIKSFNTTSYANTHKLSIQESARNLRYGWFRELIATTCYKWVLTAHHANDQLETFFMHLNRGAGLAGLCGIPERQGEVLRPLLSYSRNELLNYVIENNLEYREDSSNATDHYLRNRLRHHVVAPLLENMPQFMPSFLQSLNQLDGSRAIIRRHLSEIEKTLAKNQNGVLVFNLDKLATLKPRMAYLFELFAPYGFTDFRAIEALFTAMSGKEVLSPTHRLLKDRSAFLLKPIKAKVRDEYHFELSDVENHPPGLKISQIASDIGPDALEKEEGPNVLHIDKASLKQGMWLRKWRQGDYFCPKGMRGGKKVSKFFKDLKLSQFQKEAQWVLGSGDRIIWLPGLRGDDRFTVSKATREIIRLEWLQE